MTSRRFLIQGLVQGVGFRFFVMRRASELGLAGWVRNLPDGRVEVLAQGDEAKIGLLERKLSRGPPMARVQNVQVFPQPVDERLDGFDLRS
ncbi:MAG: acylphosphatase [Acidobacteriota bacterium]